MICFEALRAGDLDLYPEYTGTMLVEILKHEVISDAHESYAVVKDLCLRRYDLVWLEPFGLNNAYTLTMRRHHAQRLGIETISDMAEYVSGRQSP
jgi:glycine betaine/choline ABC-type transport system substrate-binding protein